MANVKGLGRGLAKTGMAPSNYILIFAETRADWMVAAQACFRQNYAGELSDLNHSFISECCRNAVVTYILL